MSKTQNRALAERAAARREQLAEREGVTNPDLAVVHPTADGTSGSGPISYNTLTEAEKRHKAIKSSLGAYTSEYGSKVMTDKDIEIAGKEQQEIELANRDNFVFQKVFSGDIPHWQGSEGLLNRRLATIKETADMQLMDAKLFYQGGFGKNEQEWDRAYTKASGEDKLSKKGVHILASELPRST